VAHRAVNLHGCALYLGPGAMRGVPRSGLWSEISDPPSGTGSERAKGRERSGVEAPREPGSSRKGFRAELSGYAVRVRMQ